MQVKLNPWEIISDESLFLETNLIRALGPSGIEMYRARERLKVYDKLIKTIVPPRIPPEIINQLNQSINTLNHETN